MALPLRPRPGPGVPYDIVPRILRAPEKLGLALRSETVRRIVFGHGAQLLRGILAGAEAAQKIIRPLAVLRPHIIHRSMARQSDFTIATDSPFAGAAKHERPCRTHEIRPVDAKLRLPHKPHRRRKRQDPFAEPEIRLPSVIAEREAAAILPQYLKRRIRLCDGVRGAGLLDRVRVKAEYDVGVRRIGMDAPGRPVHKLRHGLGDGAPLDLLAVRLGEALEIYAVAAHGLPYALPFVEDRIRKPVKVAYIHRIAVEPPAPCEAPVHLDAPAVGAFHHILRVDDQLVVPDYRTVEARAPLRGTWRCSR